MRRNRDGVVHVLAVDVSRSIDPDEARLQREGYVRALTDERVVQAIQQMLADLPGAVEEFRKTFAKLDKLSESLNLIALELGPQDVQSRKALAGKEPSELAKTISEARMAMSNIDQAAAQINRLVTDSKGGVQQFADAGLLELSLTIRELRQLTANLNIIATKLERDPAGFVFSGKQGYAPK